MQIGVTVGDSIDRLETTASAFASVEFGLAESVSVSDDIDTDRLRALTADLDVAFDIHLPFKQVVATPVPEINDAIVAYLQRLLEWGEGCGARKAVLHGTVRDPYDTSQRDVVADQLEQITDAGRACDIEVVVENVGHQQFGLQLSVLGDIARQTKTPVCFDVGHAYMEEGQDGIERFLKRDGDLISHLHVHDVRRRGDTHMPIGAGEVDFAAVGNELSDFDGTVAIEVFTDDTSLLTDSADRIRSHLAPDT